MRDHDIIALYLERDERAIEETSKQYGRLCMQVSMNVLKSRPDAEECVNDAYLKMWNSIPPARPQSLSAYLCRIVRNLSLNRFRDQHRQRRNRDLEVAFEELEECIAMPDDQISELPALLSEFLRSLEETDRHLFMGRYWHTMSVRALADKLGVTPNAVSMRLHRTCQRLKAYLEERGYTP